MPPIQGFTYDPSASFLGAHMPRPRRNPWDLPPDLYGAMDTPYRPGGSFGGAAGYVRDFTRPSEQAYNFDVNSQAPTVYADPGQAALYGSTSRPPGYGDQPSVPVVPGAPVANGAPTSEAEYWLNRWAVEQADREAQRMEQARQFNATREDQRQAAQLNAFGTFGRQSTPTAGGLAGQGMAARNEIQQERMQAQEAAAQLEAARAAQNEPVAQPHLSYGPGMGWAPGLSGVVGGPTNRPDITPPPRPADIRPQWISGPSYAMSVDQGARNTMRGNAAGGIHVSRDNVRSEGANPQDYAQWLRMLGDTSPEGEAAFAELEKSVFGNDERLNPNDPNSPLKYPGSPVASILSRGEDAGTMTPAERAYLMALRRRRGSGR